MDATSESSLFSNFRANDRNSGSEESPRSGRSSAEYSVDGTAAHTITDLSAKLKRPSPTVYSANPARRMAHERDVRIDEVIQRRQADNRANHLSSSSLNKLKAYAEIEKEITKALDGEESDLRKYADKLAAVEEARERWEKLINDDTNYYKTGCSRELWTLLAGTVSYTLTFGTGTLLASGLNIPLLSPSVIGVCWTLCERFPPMIRATSWSNKHADKTYPEIMRMAKRASRDWVRQLAGLKPKYFMRNGKKMTASQARANLSLFEAWKRKVCSDDLVSHTFTLCYIVRNVLLATLTTEAFLKTEPGMAISLGTLALAGLVAGGTAALGFQGIRGCRYRTENPDDPAGGENLVKSRKVWDAEAVLVKAKIALIEEHKKKIDTTKAETVADGIRLMEADREKAEAKSSFFSSLNHEFWCLFQRTSHAGDLDNGEVSDNRDQTCAGLIAKILCLLASALFITFVVKNFPKTNYGLAVVLVLLILAPFILIVGFGFRKECEIPPVKMIGWRQGMSDVMRYWYTHQDKYQDQEMPASPPERSPIFSNKGGVKGTQTPVSPTSQKLSGKNKPNGTVKDSSSAIASSDDEA